MSHSSEGSLENAIRNYLSKAGWKVIKAGSQKGWPDLTCFRGGGTFFIETKKGKQGKVGYYQAKAIRDLRNLGFKAEFIRSYDEFLDFYTTIMEDYNGTL